MTPDKLRDLATKIYDLRKCDRAHCDFALVLHKWAPGTLESWVDTSDYWPHPVCNILGFGKTNSDTSLQKA